jgi:hypothetical protein
MSKQTLHVLPICCKRLRRWLKSHLSTCSYWIWFGDRTERWGFLSWFSVYVDFRGSISDSEEGDDDKFWRTCGPLLRLLPVRRHSKTTREFNCTPIALEKDMRTVGFLYNERRSDMDAASDRNCSQQNPSKHHWETVLFTSVVPFTVNTQTSNVNVMRPFVLMSVSGNADWP